MTRQRDIVMRHLIILSIFMFMTPSADLAFSRDLPNALVCQSDEEAWLSTTLFFGRSISRPGGEDGEVSDEQWNSFRDLHITPRLADGYTLIDGNGHWKKSDTGALKQEKTKILIVVHPRDPHFQKKLSEIMESYKTTFSQQSVLRSVSSACIKF